MAIGLIFFVLPILLVIGGLIWGIMMWRTGSKPREGAGMGCGRCGYGVTGLTSMQCPECGADLRVVGIDKGNAQRRKLGILMSVISGGLLVLISLYFVMFFLTAAITSSRATTIPAPSSTGTAPAPSTATTPVLPPDAKVDTAEPDPSAEPDNDSP